MNGSFGGEFALWALPLRGASRASAWRGTASASEEDATWALYGDGCAYLSDGYVSYQAACPQGPTLLFWDFYVARSGQWSYGFTTSNMSSLGLLGCTAFWADPAMFIYLGLSCQ